MNIRRSTRVLAGIALIACAIVIIGRVGGYGNRSPGVIPDHPTNISESHLNELRRLAEEYSIAIEVQDAVFPGPRWLRWDGVSYGDLNDEELARFVPILASELGLYTPKFIDGIGLRRLVLCRGLIGGGAVVSWDKKGIYLDAALRGSSSGFDRLDYMPIRRLFHHELFHLWDLRYARGVDLDQAWLLLNPKAFAYTHANDGAYSRTPPADIPVASPGPCPGFVSAYSRTHAGEDKAEVYANLVVNYCAVERLSRRDEIVRGKVALLKSSLARFDPDMGSAFWDTARQRSVEDDRSLKTELAEHWVELKAGVDPADPPAQYDVPGGILRPTKCRRCRNMAYGTGSVTWVNLSIEELLAYAHNIPIRQVVMETDLPASGYDLIASVFPAESEHLWPTLRQLIDTTFGIRTRRDVRVMNVYALRRTRDGDHGNVVVAQEDGGSHGEDPTAWVEKTATPGRHVLLVRQSSFGGLASLLELADLGEGFDLGRAVFDETALSGRFDVDLEYEFRNPMSINDSLRKKLGVELVSDRRLVDVLVFHSE